MKDSLKLFNSLGKKKETFISNKKGKVSMYVCGPTVYDLLHVGNFRGPVFFNFLRKNNLSLLYAYGSYYYLLIKILRLSDFNFNLIIV